MISHIGVMSSHSGSSPDGLDSVNAIFDVVKAWIIVIIVVYSGLAIIWGILIPRFLKVCRLHQETWRKLAEFPIINHACYIIRVYFSGIVIMNGILILIAAYASYNSGSMIVIILLIICVIMAVVMAIFAYIVSTFGQVYQIMISLEIFHNPPEKSLTGQQIGQEQADKKRRIRNLYLLFLARDFLLTPALMIFQLTQTKSVESYVESVSNGSLLSTVVLTIISLIINVSVPVAFLFHLFQVSPTPETLNPLRRLILTQAKVIFIIQVIALIFSAVMVAIGVYKVQNIPYMLQMTSFMLPFIIQVTTLFKFRGLPEDILPMLENKVETIPAKF